MKRLRLGTTIVVVAGLLALTFGSRLLQRDAREWIEIASDPFVRRIDAAGELRSANTVVIGCPQIRGEWNFTLTWLADEGTEVTPGDPVARFDGQRLQERLQLVRSRLETARSQLERTRITQQSQLEQLILEQAEARARQLRLEQKLAVPETMTARVELQKLKLDREFGEEEIRLIKARIETQRANRESMIRSAENRVAGYEHDVVQLEENIALLNVIAPRSGFVVHATDWNGQKAKVGETVWSGRSILRIADLSQMEVSAEVAERDARHVREGQRVEVRLDASPDRVFTGEIRRLGKLFRTKSAAVPKMIFDVVILIDEPDPELMRPGMAAAVEILAPDENSVIQVPESAIRVVDGVPTLRVRRGGGTQEIAIELGPRWEGQVIVEQGLLEGDQVEVSPDAS